MVKSDPARVEPISGWALNYIVALDLHSRGVAGAFLRGSDERRQVSAALMAMRPLSSNYLERASLADLILNANHHEILSNAYRSVPTGLRGALSRSGPQPHAPAFYRVLHELLSSPAHSKTSEVIRQLDNLDLLRLRIALRLPADICAPSIVKLLASTRMAADVTKLVALLSSHGINRPGLAEALRRVSTSDQLGSLWDRWSQKLAFPVNPLPASDHYTPINTGRELRRLSLRYRNCARRYIARVMVGENAFGEFQWHGKRAGVLLARANGTWVLDAVFGKDNAAPDLQLRSNTERYFGERGIPTAQRPANLTDDWSVLQRLSGPHGFGS